MASFAYTAIGRDGQQTTGTLSADNRASALSQVVSQGLHPVKLDEQKASAIATAAKAQMVAKPGKVSAKAVEAFTRDLANLLAGGVPLSRAMSLLKRESSV